MAVLPPHEHQYLFGHAATMHRLKQGYDTSKLHHTLILSGAEGVGKETLAYQFIRYALANPNGNPMQDDFIIPSDHRVMSQITAGSHPNIFVIEPVYDDKKQRFKRDITLDALDGLFEFLRLTPMDDAPRFVIINPADSLNMNTQNALLKLLEEPPAKTYFLLLTVQSGQLLPTIRSRCMTIQMDAPDFGAFKKGLETFLPELSDNAIESHFILSKGALGQAIQNHELDILEAYGDICRAILSWSGERESLPAMKLAEQLSPSDNENQTSRLVSLLLDRLGSAIKANVTQKSIAAIIPEEQRVLDMWLGQPTRILLDQYDRMKAGWDTADHAYLDRKLALLQLLRSASLMDSPRQPVVA